MNKFRNLVLGTLVTGLTVSSLTAKSAVQAEAVPPTTPAHAPLTPAQQMRVDASLPTAQEEAVRLLVLADVLASREYLPDVVDVPDRIREKYESIRSSILGGGLITGTTGWLTAYLGYKSITKVEFTKKSLNQIWSLLRMGIDPSVRSSQRLSTLVFDNAFARFLYRGSEKSSTYASENLIQPVLKLVFSKGMRWAAGASSASSAFAISIKLAFNDSREILTSETARSLLNYDKAFERKLDQVVIKTAAIYSLEPINQALLKAGIRRELMKQAIEKEFRIEDKNGTPIEYRVDLIKVMLDQHLIDTDVGNAAEDVLKLMRVAWSHSPQRDDVEALNGSVQTILEVSAILESILETESLPENMEREVRQKLANTQKTLALVNNNLRN